MTKKNGILFNRKKMGFFLIEKILFILVWKKPDLFFFRFFLIEKKMNYFLSKKKSEFFLIKKKLEFFLIKLFLFLFPKISKNCHFFYSKRPPSPAKTEVLHEKLKIVLPMVILKKKIFVKKFRTKRVFFDIFFSKDSILKRIPIFLD